jgi:hypothetical protein
MKGRETMKKRSVLFAHELDSQFSPVLAAMKEVGAPLTRDEYLSMNFFGKVPDDIPEDVEETFPIQFQRATLLETPPISEKVQ